MYATVNRMQLIKALQGMSDINIKLDITGNNENDPQRITHIDIIGCKSFTTTTLRV